MPTMTMTAPPPPYSVAVRMQYAKITEEADSGSFGENSTESDDDFSMDINQDDDDYGNNSSHYARSSFSSGLDYNKLFIC